jgi:hypothetical protein
MPPASDPLDDGEIAAARLAAIVSSSDDAIVSKTTSPSSSPRIDTPRKSTFWRAYVAESE